MIAFFSVLFDPTANAFKNIEQALKNGFTPVVYLNRVHELQQRKLEEIGVITLGKNINAGLGVAFKEAEQYFIENQYKYYVYFDQDTIVGDMAWKKILITHEYGFKNNDTGLLFYGYSNKNIPKLVVSSGCLFSLQVVQQYGGHNDTFFVEGVDYEYCLTLDENKLKILHFAEKEIDHFTLQDSDIKEIYGFKFKCRVYGKSRANDFNTSHYKLIKRCFKNKRTVLLILFIKSLVVFNLKELTSKLFMRF